MSEIVTACFSLCDVKLIKEEFVFSKHVSAEITSDRKNSNPYGWNRGKKRK